MLFTSPIFLFYFLPLVLALYFMAPGALRNGLLLLASLVFYAFGEGYFVAVMLLSIGVNYLVGLGIDRHRGTGRAGGLLALAIVFNLVLLAVFKYAAFIVQNLNTIGDASILPVPDIHLPLGISFFTFQAMSYVVDVHRGSAPVCRDPLRCGLYIALFPQLIAGPIVRYSQIAEQLVERRVASDRFVSGLRRFTMGLAKKMLLANPLGSLADAIFATPAQELDPVLAWSGALIYGLQIYLDFSAYSDMAIGLGRLFGFSFPENFRYPYTADSIREFWRRWHISLSTWFRDYLYIPLGGNRRGRLRTAINLMTVFLLCGLWHGASWNFVIWGALHGALLALERGSLGVLIGRLWRPLRHVYVLAAVATAWVFFRLDSTPAAMDYVAVMYGFGDGDAIPGSLALLLGREQLLVLGIAVALSAGVYQWSSERFWIPRGRESVLGYGLSHLLLLGTLLPLALLSVASSVYNPFIYFRF